MTPPDSAWHIRALDHGLEVRDAADGTGRVLRGHFARFGEWTTIHERGSRFLERVAPGAFARTFREDRSTVKVLFQHGRDPAVGDKPLGRIIELREDSIGAYYEVALSRTTFNDDLVAMLEDGTLGASFRFQAMSEDVDPTPERSEHNPEGLEERALTSVRLFEFGPVTFPAYENASAGVRSLSDEFAERRTIPRPGEPVSNFLIDGVPMSLDEELTMRAQRLAELWASVRTRPVLHSETDEDAFWRGVDALLANSRTDREDVEFTQLLRDFFWERD